MSVSATTAGSANPILSTAVISGSANALIREADGYPEIVVISPTTLESSTDPLRKAPVL